MAGRAVREEPVSTASGSLPDACSALVNGAAGIVGFDQQGRPFAVMGFTVAHGKIVAIDILADPARLRELDLSLLND